MSLAQNTPTHQFWWRCVDRCDLWARWRNQKRQNKNGKLAIHSPRPPT